MNNFKGSRLARQSVFTTCSIWAIPIFQHLYHFHQWSDYLTEGPNTGKKFWLGTDEIWYRQVVYTANFIRAKPSFWGPIPISPELFHKISVL